MLSFLFWAAIIALDIWAVLNVWRSKGTGDVAKVLWALGIFVFPILGLIVWGVAGPKDQKLLPKR
jgi:hypothetical protein